MELVSADSCREIVPVVNISKVGEPDAVLDVDRVVVRPGDERPGEAEGEPVVLNWAPGLDLADRPGGGRGPGALVQGDTAASLGAMTWSGDSISGTIIMQVDYV